VDCFKIFQVKEVYPFFVHPYRKYSFVVRANPLKTQERARCLGPSHTPEKGSKPHSKVSEGRAGVRTPASSILRTAPTTQPDFICVF
jgi:hypothetical protein